MNFYDARFDPYTDDGEPATSAHEHVWEVEYLPDPTSAGGVVRSGDLFCSCGATMQDVPATTRTDRP